MSLMRSQAEIPALCILIQWFASAMTEDGRPVPLFTALLGLITLAPRVEDDAPQAAPAQLVKHLRTDAEVGL